MTYWSSSSSSSNSLLIITFYSQHLGSLVPALQSKARRTPHRVQKLSCCDLILLFIIICDRLPQLKCFTVQVHSAASLYRDQGYLYSIDNTKQQQLTSTNSVTILCSVVNREEEEEPRSQPARQWVRGNVSVPFWQLVVAY